MPKAVKSAPFKQIVLAKCRIFAGFMLLICGLARADFSAPVDLSQAEALYLQTIQSHDLVLTERLARFNAINDLLAQHADSRLKVLVTYQLALTSIRSRDEQAYQSHINQLKGFKIAKDQSAIDFLINKLEFEYLYFKNQYSEVVKVGNSILSSNDIKYGDFDRLQPDSLTISQFEVSDVMNTLGKAYYLTGQYQQASRYFIDAIDGFEQIGDKKGVSKLYNNLSVIAWAQKDVAKALSYLDNGLAISRDIGDIRSILSKLSNKGLYLNALGKLKQAQEAFAEALEHPNLVDYPKLHINTLLASSEVETKLKNLQVSESLIQQALQISSDISDDYSQANSQMALAGLLSKQGMHARAINQYLIAIDYYRNRNLLKELLNAHLNITDSYIASGQYQNALDNYKQYHLLSKKLADEANQKGVLKLQQQYEASARLKEIELLKKQNSLTQLEVAAAKSRQVTFVIYTAIALVIFFLMILGYLSRKESSKLKALNKDLAAREKQLKLLSIAFKNTNDGVWISDTDFTIEVVNEAFIRQTQRPAPIGRRVGFAHVKGQNQALTEAVLRQIIQQGRWSGEVYDKKANGVIYPIEITIESIRDEHGEVIKYLGTFRDISKRRAAEDKLKQLATQDELTHLPNRVLVKELIQRAIIDARQQNGVFSVMFIDVDGFKKINDSLGHEVGDQLICAIAKRLENSICINDVLARVGGDEFVVLTDTLSKSTQAAIKAGNIVSAFEKPFELNGRVLKTSVSIGIALYPDDANDAENLVREADIAMNAAKHDGKDTFNFYKSHMNETVQSMLELEQKIVQAIEEKRFEFFYQPIIDLKTGQITGAEALIRCRETDNSLIYPDEFIPFAEQSGLIEKIDQCVIEQVFSQIRRWRDEALILKHVSINLSAKIFSHPERLFRMLERGIRSNNILAKDIKLEITEGMLIDDTHRAIETMQKLKQMGFILAIDDFGTGFSSLSYLKLFPVDVLKIDRTFVMDMSDSDKSNCIVKSIIDLAHCLEFTLVAEGVETLEHRDKLNSMGCEEYQGYYYSRPISATDFKALYQEKSALGTTSN
jgi:diguanylate cyclase (GGDEF)-like protein/PAS domain S-box-containing protein